jgi:hypothetical protein
MGLCRKSFASFEFNEEDILKSGSHAQGVSRAATLKAHSTANGVDGVALPYIEGLWNQGVGEVGSVVGFGDEDGSRRRVDDSRATTNDRNQPLCLYTT